MPCNPAAAVEVTVLVEMGINGQGLGLHESSATCNQDVFDIIAIGELGNANEG